MNRELPLRTRPEKRADDRFQTLEEVQAYHRHLEAVERAASCAAAIGNQVVQLESLPSGSTTTDILSDGVIIHVRPTES